MKNAQEIFDINQENTSKKYLAEREQVSKKVDEFTEEWAIKGGFYRIFTEEEMTEKFINSITAKEILQDAGFEITFTPAEKTGHLWWKKTIPAKWMIRIPVKKK